ncbi:isochorismatase family cysteine hydrolase [Xanthobacter oligotrophicus]|uniref:Isochorismatase family cysteine hydrolase n=1 Tax=Xanthobacter oligotrophicus TaxID=2607286 RepID=A0ABW7A1M2_9HYPH
MTRTEPVPLADFPDRFAPAHTALLIIIDMQKDFCVDGFAASAAGRPLQAAQAIVPAIADLRAAARRAGVLVCHVGFWTLPGHLSDSGPWLAQRRRSTYASDRIAIAGTRGADFVPELSPVEGEVGVHKHRYSAFKGTDLDMVLRAHGIAAVAVCGVSTNVCVESTLHDAFEHGYYVTAVGDACASWDTDLHRASPAGRRVSGSRSASGVKSAMARDPPRSMRAAQ